MEMRRAQWGRTIFRSAISILPGLTFVFAACAAARLAAHYFGAPFMLVALLTGLSLGFARKTSFLKSGISLAAKPLLRAGVALLGVQISLSTIFALGGSTIIMLAFAIGVTVAAAAGI
ncbi:MAG: putative sulfate exporter family transporter, partial [Alphaproteobacteria bacterium]|nr:putative sulfate exporter family transporter [Alphaproteobacteria bacterium]